MTEARSLRRARRVRRIRRRIAFGAIVALVAAGGIVTWRLTRSTAPQYRLAAVERADVAQTVDTDGIVSVVNRAALRFATAGGVNHVLAKAGSRVSAGDIVATLDPASLDAAVTSATQHVANAQQTLADDEAAQSSSSTLVSSSSATPTSTARPTSTSSLPTQSAAYSAVHLASAPAPTSSSTSGVSPRSSAAPTSVPIGARSGTSSRGSGTGLTPSGATSGVAAVTAAQHSVVTAVHTVDAALKTEDSDIAAAATACSATVDGPALTVGATANSLGAITGSVGGQAGTVTLIDKAGSVDTTTSSPNPQKVVAGGKYRFAGLTASTDHQLMIASTDKVVDAATCAQRMITVDTDRIAVDAAAKTLDSTVPTLMTAVAALSTTGLGHSSTGSASSSTGTPRGGNSSPALPTGGSSRTGSRPQSSGSGPSGSSSSSTSSAGMSRASGSGSIKGSGSGSGSRVITAEQIVADQKAIDAAQTNLDLAKSNKGLAYLTTPISGTVADLAIADGQQVNTSTAAMIIVGGAQKSVTVDIGIGSIDLIKVGEKAVVTVDGRTTAISGTVTGIGVLNTASGSSASYAVTINLASAADPVHDGTGATVAISVRTARQVLTVPQSALHTTGTVNTVEVLSGSTLTETRVTLGVSGSDRVQVVSGLTAGQRVMLADVDAAIPSATTTTGRFGYGAGRAGLGGTGLGGTGGFGGGGFTGRQTSP